MDGWNTIVSFFGMAYFQGLLLLVSGSVKNLQSTVGKKLFRYGSEVEAIAVADDVAESDADVTWCFTGKSAIKKHIQFFLILFDNDDSHDQPLSIVDQIIIFHKRIPAVFIDQTSSTPKLSRSGSLDPPIPLSLVTTVHVLEFELFSFNHR